MSNIVIKAEQLSKYYRLGVINNGALFRDLQTWIALKTGKHDPHSRIGENKYDPTKEGFWALSDLNFEIQQGDRVGIIGKNGAGKSTLLKILSRITAPTEGQVKIKGRVASLLEVGTGFHGELTGRENIYLNGAILGMKRREVTRKLDEIIGFSEIEQHIDTPVKRYSSGMYVRLAFAVAAHLDSEILIADEVLAVGDASFQKKALGKMNDLSTGQGRTVLFVSHNMGSVKALCNKGIVLERGRVVCEGRIEEAINRYMDIGNQTADKNGIPLLWENKKNEFQNEYFQPIQLAIYNTRKQLHYGSLNATEKYIVGLKFNVQEKNPLVNFWIVFYVNEVKQLVVVSDKLTEGINEVFYDVPNNFLVPNANYIISLGSSIKNTDYILNPTDYNISIYFTTTEETPWSLTSFYNEKI